VPYTCPTRARHDGGFRPQIQNPDDPYYKKPQALLEGCGCRKQCSKKCRCLVSVDRGNRCSRLTCKFCSCFKREADSLSEDLQLSTAFQNMLDEMSDCDTSDSSDYDESDSEVYLSDFEDHFFAVLDCVQLKVLVDVIHIRCLLGKL